MKEKIVKKLLGLCVVTLVIFSITAVAALVEKENNPLPALTAAADTVYEDPLADFILEQEQLRSMQLAGLDEIVNNEASSDEMVEAAQMEKIELLSRINTEQTISGILRARGYKGAAAAASNGHVTIMIRASQADDTAVVRITELIVSQTSLNTADIKIIPIN